MFRYLQERRLEFSVSWHCGSCASVRFFFFFLGFLVPCTVLLLLLCTSAALISMAVYTVYKSTDCFCCYSMFAIDLIRASLCKANLDFIIYQ